MINWLQGLGGNAPFKFGRQKTSKIWRYLGKHSTLSSSISGMDESSDKLLTELTRIISLVMNKKKFVNFGPLPTKLTLPKSTMHVLHMLMHLSSGHVNLLLGKFDWLTD